MLARRRREVWRACVPPRILFNNTSYAVVLAGRFGGLQALQEPLVFAASGRQSRPEAAKKKIRGGGAAAPHPHCVSPVSKGFSVKETGTQNSELMIQNYIEGIRL